MQARSFPSVLNVAIGAEHWTVIKPMTSHRKLIIRYTIPYLARGLQEHPGGFPGKPLMGFVARFCKSWRYFRPKKRHFPPTRFQTLRRQKICHICYQRLFEMELKTYEMISYVFKSISNSHITLSFFFGIETTNTLILSRSSLENHTRFHTKRAKSTNWFKDINGAKKKHTLWGARTYMA